MSRGRSRLLFSSTRLLGPSLCMFGSVWAEFRRTQPPPATLTMVEGGGGRHYGNTMVIFRFLADRNDNVPLARV